MMMLVMMMMMILYLMMIIAGKNPLHTALDMLIEWWSWWGKVKRQWRISNMFRHHGNTEVSHLSIANI